jgi:hypothetical protein
MKKTHPLANDCTVAEAMRREATPLDSRNEEEGEDAAKGGKVGGTHLMSN